MEAAMTNSQTATRAAEMSSDHDGRKREARAQAENISGQRGFTLIETVISLVIMMTVSLAVMSLFFYATNYNTGSNDRAIATAIAQEQLEKLRAVSYSDSSLNVGTTGPTTVTRGGRSYSVGKTITVSNGLKTITISVTPTGAGPTWAGTAVTVITQRAILTSGAYMLP
jgi:Tfp pilus assembly protein PilV